MTNHRTSSIQRPITGEVTRPTRRRRRVAADGTPGRGLPERPLPGRPGNVLRTDTIAAARPTRSHRQPAATVGRATAPAGRRGAGGPTPVLPLTEPLLRKAATDRPILDRSGTAPRAAATTAADGPQQRRRPLAAVPGQPADPPARRSRTPEAQPGGLTRRGEHRAPPAGRAPARRTRRGEDLDAAPSAGGRLRRAATRDAAAAPRASAPRASALRDVTRPIARDSRMAERRPVRIGYGLIAGAIGLALVAALVVLPIRRWWNQRADLADRRNELGILREANSRLGNDIAALTTPEGIEAEARTALNFGFPGEERTRSVGDPQAPVILPTGYPYSLVTSILVARTNLAAASPNPATTLAATGETVPAGAAADTTAPPSTEPPEPTIAPPAGPLPPSAP